MRVKLLQNRKKWLRYHGKQLQIFEKGSDIFYFLRSVSWLRRLPLFFDRFSQRTRRYILENERSIPETPAIFFRSAADSHEPRLGPAIGALTGITSSVLWKFYKEEQEKWTSWLLLAAFLATMLFEALVLYQNGLSDQWVYLSVAGGLILFLTSAILRSKGWQKNQKYAAIAGLIILLAAPLYWALPSTFNQTNSSIPVAGPSSTQSGGMGGQQGGSMPQMAMARAIGSGERFWSNGQTVSPGGTEFPADRLRQLRSGGDMSGQVSQKLLSYLEKHDHGEKFILAVQRAQSAYSIMLKTNYAVMAMGGFQGNDPAVDAAKLGKMAKAGDVKYFLISGGQGAGSNQSALQWIKKSCSIVPPSEWSAGNRPAAVRHFMFIKVKVNSGG